MTEREAFEKWASANQYDGSCLARRDGGYAYEPVDAAWAAWQARASQPAAAVPRELSGKVLHDVGVLIAAATKHCKYDGDLFRARAQLITALSEYGAVSPKEPE